MWDDSRYNNAQVKDYFGFVFHGKCVAIRKIIQTADPSERLPSWSLNVGQRERKVLYLSNEILRIDWNTWLELGGHKSVYGTTYVKNSSMITDYIEIQGA